MDASSDIDPLARAEAAWLAQRYVAAYNDRDLQGMLALHHEKVVSYPLRLYGHRGLTGREGVVASGRWYEVIVDEVRQLGPDLLAIFGGICDRGERIAPWGALVRVRDGLIIESRSYLSDEETLERVGLLKAARPRSDAPRLISSPGCRVGLEPEASGISLTRYRGTI